MTINELLVKKLSVSHKNAIDLIRSKKIFINGLPALQRQLVTEDDKVTMDYREISSPATYKYVVFYKPRGIECSLNPRITDSLFKVLPFKERLFPVGRLDKESEGLLLLTNDGNLYKEIAGSEVYKEKEYLVQVDKKLSDVALSNMRTGVEMMGKKTRPCVINQIDDTSFSIILTQGLNRQIRRMCYKQGYEVITLKRIRIMSLVLGDLHPGEYKFIKKGEVFS